ncbi:hypothetical protein [Mycobacterium tuberculosis]|uniref:hypothetical protein n=1 Tax=Mycobacterium tuberculosis TaxID=1773 RepID=UPI00272CA881|nr:hypothetical protein [Mycobacterium tuberculosis]
MVAAGMFNDGNVNPGRLKAPCGRAGRRTELAAERPSPSGAQADREGPAAGLAAALSWLPNARRRPVHRPTGKGLRPGWPPALVVVLDHIGRRATTSARRPMSAHDSVHSS